MRHIYIRFLSFPREFIELRTSNQVLARRIQHACCAAKYGLDIMTEYMMIRFSALHKTGKKFLYRMLKKALEVNSFSNLCYGGTKKVTFKIYQRNENNWWQRFLGE